MKYESAFVLRCFREYHGQDENNVARKTLLKVEKYLAMEAGICKVNKKNALKFSRFYKAPLQIFLSDPLRNNFPIIYTHCNFNNSNAYVNHNYGDGNKLWDLLKVQERIIIMLEKEIERLRHANFTSYNIKKN